MCKDARLAVFGLVLGFLGIAAAPARLGAG